MIHEHHAPWQLICTIKIIPSCVITRIIMSYQTYLKLMIQKCKRPKSITSNTQFRIAYQNTFIRILAYLRAKLVRNLLIPDSNRSRLTHIEFQNSPTANPYLQCEVV
ncbi:hypothetical protein M758_1G023900 [Ceratodon purpureus]|nr:hypothetical protein M758_1G023900 [Ceratodon purpureus]